MKACRICAKELYLKAEPECPPEWAEALSKIPMCCDPCGDYGWRRRLQREKMQRIAISIIGQGGQPSEKQTAAMIGMTKHYVKLVCAFYQVRVEWQQEFPKMILTSPQHCLRVLDEFEKGIAGMAGRPLLNFNPVTYKSARP